MEILDYFAHTTEHGYRKAKENKFFELILYRQNTNF